MSFSLDLRFKFSYCPLLTKGRRIRVRHRVLPVLARILLFVVMNPAAGQRPLQGRDARRSGFG